MDAIDLLNCSPRINAIRDVEFHGDEYDSRDVTRIERIMAGEKMYNIFYDVFPIEVNGVLWETTTGLSINSGDTIIFHPSGTITAEDKTVMKKLVLSCIKPSETAVYVNE